jgi:thiol-disulfide isomerase/thioredoxin
MNMVDTILAFLMGLTITTIGVGEAERAKADVAAACCYAALTDGAELAPQPKALPLRALVFSAEGCAPCNALHDALTADLPGKGWRIGASATDHLEFVEFSKDRARAAKYGITATPTTVIVDESGNQKAKVVGGMSSEFFVKWCAEKGLTVSK